jgi:uncharacterized membrane protein YeiH
MATAYVQSTIEWMAIFVTAVVGVYEARQQKLDFLGTLVIAVAASLGGGTMRDVLLGRYPLYWLQNPLYLTTITGIALLATFVFHQRDTQRTALRHLIWPVTQMMRQDKLPLFVVALDALGLGLFGYLGSSYALSMHTAVVVAPVLGMITAAFGGVVKDVFFARVPSIFRRTQLYATCALFGSCIYVSLHILGMNSIAAGAVCLVATFVLRVLTVKYNWRLPF